MDKHELKLRASAVVLIHALLALKTVASDQVILTQVEYAQCAVRSSDWSAILVLHSRDSNTRINFQRTTTWVMPLKTVNCKPCLIKHRCRVAKSTSYFGVSGSNLALHDRYPQWYSSGPAGKCRDSTLY
jgi:hypothetical protein